MSISVFRHVAQDSSTSCGGWWSVTGLSHFSKAKGCLLAWSGRPWVIRVEKPFPWILWRTDNLIGVLFSSHSLYPLGRTIIANTYLHSLLLQPLWWKVTASHLALYCNAAIIDAIVTIRSIRHPSLCIFSCDVNLTKQAAISPRSLGSSGCYCTWKGRIGARDPICLIS